MNQCEIHIWGVYRFKRPIIPLYSRFIVVREHGSGFLCRYIDDPHRMTTILFKEEILKAELIVPGIPIEVPSSLKKGGAE